MKNGLIFIFLFLILGINIVLAAHNEDGLNPDDFFYCHDSDDTSKTVFNEGNVRVSMGGVSGMFNYFEKGETYGKERLYSEDFVTKKDTCVITETIPVTEEFLTSDQELDEPTKKLMQRMIRDEGTLDKEIENTKWLKKIQELQYNEGAQLVSPREGELVLIRCADGNCDSAKVDSCEAGENCGVLENWCSISATFNDYFKLLIKHPIQAMRLLSGDVNARSVYSTVSAEPCENGCSNGACIE